MEITARRRRRGWWRALRALAVAAVLLAVALMIPPALGLQARVVTDGSAAAAISRGSVVLVEPMAASGLDAGDVVTFRPPGADSGADLVTRRIVAVGAGWFQTRGDEAADLGLWQIPVDQVQTDRAVLSVPVVGYPVLALGGVALPAWGPAVVALGLACLLMLLRRSSALPVDESDGLRSEVVMTPSSAPAPPSLG